MIIIKNIYYIKREQAGLIFRGNSSIAGAGAKISGQSLQYLAPTLEFQLGFKSQYFTNPKFLLPEGKHLHDF